MGKEERRRREVEVELVRFGLRRDSGARKRRKGDRWGYLVGGEVSKIEKGKGRGKDAGRREGEERRAHLSAFRELERASRFPLDRQLIYIKIWSKPSLSATRFIPEVSKISSLLIPLKTSRPPSTFPPPSLPLLPCLPPSFNIPA